MSCWRAVRSGLLLQFWTHSPSAGSGVLVLGLTYRQQRAVQEPEKQDADPAPLPASPISVQAKPRYPLSPRAAVAAVDPRLDVDRILIAGCLANALSPYISDPYLIHECLLPWLLNLQQLDPDFLHDPASRRSPRARHCTPLATAVTILEAVLDDWELKAVVQWSFRMLAMHALGETVGSEQQGSLPHVATAAALLGSEGRATEMLLSWQDLRQTLEWLLAIRRPSEAALKQELPHVRVLTLLQCVLVCPVVCGLCMLRQRHALKVRLPETIHASIAW